MLRIVREGWCLWLCREKNCSRELSPCWPSLCGVETSSSHWAAGPQRTELTWMMTTVMIFKRKNSLSICPHPHFYCLSCCCSFSSCKHTQRVFFSRFLKNSAAHFVCSCISLGILLLLIMPGIGGVKCLQSHCLISHKNVMDSFKNIPVRLLKIIT